MNYIEILTKKHEKQIRSLYRRKKRREEQLCICEGIRACRELYKNTPELIEFGVVSENCKYELFDGVKFWSTPDDKFEKLSATVNSQGIMLIF